MPLHPVPIIIGSTLAIIGSGYAFKKIACQVFLFVYDPHLGPYIEAFISAHLPSRHHLPSTPSWHERDHDRDRELVTISSTSARSTATENRGRGLRRRRRSSSIVDVSDRDRDREERMGLLEPPGLAQYEYELEYELRAEREWAMERDGNHKGRRIGSTSDRLGKPDYELDENASRRSYLARQAQPLIDICPPPNRQEDASSRHALFSTLQSPALSHSLEIVPSLPDCGNPDLADAQQQSEDHEMISTPMTHLLQQQQIDAPSHPDLPSSFTLPTASSLPSFSQTSCPDRSETQPDVLSGQQAVEHDLGWTSVASSANQQVPADPYVGHAFAGDDAFARSIANMGNVPEDDVISLADTSTSHDGLEIFSIHSSPHSTGRFTTSAPDPFQEVISGSVLDIAAVVEGHVGSEPPQTGNLGMVPTDDATNWGHGPEDLGMSYAIPVRTRRGSMSVLSMSDDEAEGEAEVMSEDGWRSDEWESVSRHL